MNDQSMDQAFHKAVESDSDAYIAARDAILKQPAEAPVFLAARRASLDWKTALVAEIAAGWLEHAQLFRQCTDYVHGKIPTIVPPITGKLVARARVPAVSGLGRAVVPRLLEMLWKTRDWGDQDGLATVFGVLNKFQDARAAPVLIEIARGDKDQSLRNLAAASLGRFPASQAAPVLLALLKNPSEPEMVRANAAIGLGSLGAREAAPTLRAIVLDRKLDQEFREAAIRALHAMRDTESSATLVEALSGAEDVTWIVMLVDTLADLGNAASLPALRDLETHHEGDTIGASAREAAAKIKERLAR